MPEEKKWEELAARLNGEAFDSSQLTVGKKDQNKAEKTDMLLKANRKLLIQMQKVKTSIAWQRFEVAKKRQSRKQFVSRLVGAAAVILILMGSGYFLNTLIHYQPVRPEIYTTLTIPNGEMGNIQLSDGTKIFLNSGTKLRYYDNFKAKREVYLTGEAFFEVNSDKENPFYIHLDDFMIKVTGTKFNVRSYADGNPETVLIEGKITILNTQGSELIDLKPNQTLLFEKSTRKIFVSETNTSRCDWRDGEIFLKNQPLSEIAKMLERWYDVDFEFAEESVKSIRLTGTVLKNKPLEQILEVIKISEPLDFDFQYKDQQLSRIKISYKNHSNKN